MSGYRDDREAAQARIETLEAQLREREAAVDARDAELRELRAQIARLRTGEPRAVDENRSPMVATIAVGTVAALLVVGGLFAFLLVRTPARQPAAAPVATAVTATPLPVAPPAPEPATTTPTQPPALTDAMRPLVQKAKSCYERELPQRPNLSGRVEVTVTVAGGRVTEVAFDASPVRSPSFDACMRKLLVGAPMPATSEPTQVRLPLVFQAG